MIASTGRAGKKEILITGFGGQGIVLAGQILGRAASLKDHMESTLTQSYGPEARGGACSAQVIISDKTIHYPYVRQPDVLICMSQGGFEKYGQTLQDESVLIYDQDLVQPGHPKCGDMFAVPATRIAEELGRKMMANIVLIGVFTAVSGALSVEAARSATQESVPKGSEEKNLQAFNKGYDFGIATLKGRKKKAASGKGSQS